MSGKDNFYSMWATANTNFRVTYISKDKNDHCIRQDVNFNQNLWF